MFSFLFRKWKCMIRCSVTFRDRLERLWLQPSEASHLVISLPTQVLIIRLPHAREMWMCCCPKVECYLGTPIFPATKFLRMVTAKTLPAEICKIWCLQTVSAIWRLHLREITEASTGISTAHIGKIPWNWALLRKRVRVPVDRTR